MAIITTPRLGITRWTSDQDSFTRSHMDNSHIALEEKGIAFLHGTSRPSASSSYLGTFYWNTSTSGLSYCDGTQWVDMVAGTSGFGTPSTLVVGQVYSDGTAVTGSRSDHRHGLFAFGTSTVAVGTSRVTGVATTPSRSDHVHEIAAGAIDSSLLFTAGVVDNAALATNSVDTSEFANDAVTAPKIATGAVGNTELATNAIAQVNMDDNSVGVAEIIAGSVAPSELKESELYDGTTDSVYAQFTGNAGVSGRLARSDHQHASNASAPTWVGTGNSEGTDTNFARADHLHEIRGELWNNSSPNYSAVIQPIWGGEEFTRNIYTDPTWVTFGWIPWDMPTGWSTAQIIVSGSIRIDASAGVSQPQARWKLGTTYSSIAQGGATASGDNGWAHAVHAYDVTGDVDIYLEGSLSTSGGTAAGQGHVFVGFAIKTS